MHPRALGIVESTQPEIFRGTVKAMVRQLATNPSPFWQDAFAKDGPLTIWEINGQRYLFNGNHRYQAALQADLDIPDDSILVVHKTGIPIQTCLLKDLTLLPGVK